ncbi:MAG: SdrD B-like domain-containing protein [Candidatus Methanomethylicaceae archaeon]
MEISSFIFLTHYVNPTMNMLFGKLHNESHSSVHIKEGRTIYYRSSSNRYHNCLNEFRKKILEKYPNTMTDKDVSYELEHLYLSMIKSFPLDAQLIRKSIEKISKELQEKEGYSPGPFIGICQINKEFALEKSLSKAMPIKITHTEPKPSEVDLPKISSQIHNHYDLTSHSSRKYNRSNNAKKIALILVMILAIVSIASILMVGFFPKTVAVSGLIYNDANQNGILESIDLSYSTLLSNVTVHLINETGYCISKCIPNSTGYYEFVNLTPGLYELYLVMPVNCFNSTPLHKIVNITNTNLTNVNFGVFTTYKIIGEVYSDKNRNGIRDRTETGFSEALIYLNEENNRTIAFTKSNSEGVFCFDNLTYGTYWVKIVTPYGCINTTSVSHTLKIHGGDKTVFFGIYNLLTEPKEIQYEYVLKGVKGTVNFTVYKGLYDYLKNISNPFGTYQEVVLRYVNEPIEAGEINKLANEITKITPNKDDQVRITISLVQHIPYGGGTNWMYPYEVLYANQGVCSDKSRLLVCLLRELGYGCALLEFPEQNHEAVGIKCPIQYAYYQNYAFVESAGVVIPTYWQSKYAGDIQLPSTPNYVIQIYEGLSFDSIAEEYSDAQTWYALSQMGQILDWYHYNQWLSLVNKYDLLHQ